MTHLAAGLAPPHGHVAPVELGHLPRLLAVVLLVDLQPVVADELLVAVLAHVHVGLVVAELVPLQVVPVDELLAADVADEGDAHPLVGLLDVDVGLEHDVLRVELALVPLVLVLGGEVGLAVLAVRHRGYVGWRLRPPPVERRAVFEAGRPHRELGAVVEVLRVAHVRHLQLQLLGLLELLEEREGAPRGRGGRQVRVVVHFDYGPVHELLGRVLDLVLERARGAVWGHLVDHDVGDAVVGHLARHFRVSSTRLQAGSERQLAAKC